MNQLRMRIVAGDMVGYLVTGGDMESVSAILLLED